MYDTLSNNPAGIYLEVDLRAYPSSFLPYDRVNMRVALDPDGYELPDNRRLIPLHPQ